MSFRLSAAPAALNRARRRAGFDRNPMRRREDRIQTAAVTVVIALLLAFTPWAVAATAVPVYSDGVRTEHAETAARHKVTAKIFDPGPRTSTLRVTWQDARGARHTGDYKGTGIAGATTTIWVDHFEHVVTPPHTRTETISDATLTGIYVVMGVLGVAAVMLGLLARRLNRSRYRRWDSDWAAADGSRGRHPEGS